MADFTLWRFHECNRNFLRDFLGDKKRLAFWLAAFFLIFWNRTTETTSAATFFSPGLLSASGAFLILILTSFLANRLFNRKIEILSGWFLLTSPGFLLFARSGTLLPFATALELTALIHALSREKEKTTSFFQGFIFGILCSAAAWCGAGLETILLFILCILPLRNSPLPGWKAVLGFLCGSAAFPALLLLRTHPIQGTLHFRNWLPPPRPALPTNDVLFSALTPWFWLIPAALGVLNRRILSASNGTERNRMLLVFVVSTLMLVLCGWFALGFASILPCFAILTAWALLEGRDKFPRPHGDCFQILLRFFDLLQIPLIAGALAAPLLLILFHDPAHYYTCAEAGFYYFQLPAAGLAAALWNIWIHIRRKRGITPIFSPSCPALDRILPSVWITMLILMD